MVLSNKKLKQRLRAESAQQQGILPLTSDKPKSIKKREKKRQKRQQPEATPETSPIDRTVLDKPKSISQHVKKQLRRQQLETPLAEQPALPETSPIDPTELDKPKSINKREKKRQRLQQLETPSAEQTSCPEASPINQTELDTYYRCIETLSHKSGSNQSFRQGQDAEKISESPFSPVNESRAAEVSLSQIKTNEEIALNVDNSSLLKASVKSRKQNRASKTNGRAEELDQNAVNHSSEDQDSSVSRTVYVGGIPYYSSEDDIRAFFGDCGTIHEANLKTFTDSGKFCGIALLTFKTLGGAQRALALDGSNMGDRFLKIQPCATKPKEPMKKEVYNAPPTKTEGYTRAYIGNLSWSVTEEDIKDFFKDCKIAKVNFSEDKVTGDFRGFGHVDFADDESLEQALQLDQHILLERPIKVAYAVPSRNEKRGSTTPRDRKDITCHTCGEKGHVSARCPYMGRGQ